MTPRDDSARILREFIRRAQAVEGALDAADALHDIEARLLDVEGDRARELAYSDALVSAQGIVRAAIKDKKITLRDGKGGFSIVETDQLLELAREAMAPYGLAIESGNAETVMVSNTAFVRVVFGLRHKLGAVHTSSRDFPLAASGDPGRVYRGAITSALGAWLRDTFAIERREDESEQHENEVRRSGVRRPFSPAPTSSPPPARSHGPSPAPAKLSERAEGVRQGILGLKGLEALDKAASTVADKRQALSEENPPYTEAEVVAFEKAIEDRRDQLSGGGS